VLTASTGRSRAGGIEASGLTAPGRRSEPPSDTVRQTTVCWSNRLVTAGFVPTFATR